VNHLKTANKKKISHRFRFKEGDEEYCQETKTKFTFRYCLFEDSSVIIDSLDFDFLKYLDCAKDKEYLYAIWETKLNIIKIGKTTKIFKRIKQHLHSFLRYGGSNKKDIKIIFTKRPVSIYNELEQSLLNSFSICPFIKGYVGEEFFKIDDDFNKSEIQEKLISLFNSDKTLF
jgi:hypothetical protein